MAEVQANTKNNKALGRILIIIVVLVLISGGYMFWLHLSKFESTDDAQVDGQIYAISSRVNGHVIDVKVDDEQEVKAGDVLVVLDPKDFEVAVSKARADLADAVANYASSRNDVPITSTNTKSTLTTANSTRLDASAGVSGSERQLGAARARLSTAQANVRVAQANYTKAAQDVERYKQLVSKDEISKQQYDQAVAAMDAARATLDAQNAQVNEATQNISVAEKNVEQAQTRVQQADAQIQAALTGPQQVKVTEAKAQSAAAKIDQQRALLDQAELNLKYTTIVAPVDGVVGKKNVAIGQNTSAGQELMAVVPLDGLWVTANFKETQLQKMRVGQTVKIRVDAYDREYTGKVQRLAGASGARFSLLPPENATGNYVKVVQRIPVRIALDPGQNNDHLLREGMSVTPTVQLQ
ncbi:MAG TPA: HlyD family secretion protein [Bryobacteraceae bacterium]|jgi:membrane fusion protein (multidrug efflux system)|nr:HlyD family secretion protein [Bryobacteraceae bacterium]